MKYLFVLALLTVAISACHKPIKKDDSLKDFITANTKPDSGILYLNKFDKIKWDKLYIIVAYHGKDFFDDNLKKYSSEILNTGIEYKEGPTLFALYDKDALVNLTELDQSYYFVDAVKYKGKKLSYYTKKDAVFNFKYYSNARWKGYKPILTTNK